MAFWLGEDVRVALTNLRTALSSHTAVKGAASAEQQKDFSELLSATELLLKPGFVLNEDNPGLSQPLLLLFTQFRIFENYIFFKSKAPSDKAREAIIVVFEMLVDFMCQYYWDIRALFDPVLKDPVLDCEPSRTLQELSQKYEANRRAIADAVQTPFLYHKAFINNSTIVKFHQQYAMSTNVLCHNLAKKIGELTRQSYGADDRGAIYLSLLTTIQDIKFDRVSDAELRGSHEPIKYFFVTFYFQLLGCLLFSNIMQSFLYNNVDPKEYDYEARAKLQVFSLRSPEAARKTRGVRVPLSSSEKCQQCNNPQIVGGPSIEKCPNCGEPYHIPCMKKVITYVGGLRIEKIMCSSCQQVHNGGQTVVAEFDVSKVCAAVNCKSLITTSDAGAKCAATDCTRMLCQTCAVQQALHPTCHYRQDRSECRARFIMRVRQQDQPPAAVDQPPAAVDQLPAAAAEPSMPVGFATIAMERRSTFAEIRTEFAEQRVIRTLPPWGPLSGQVPCSICNKITAEAVCRYLQNDRYEAWVHRSCLMRRAPQFFAQAAVADSDV